MKRQIMKSIKALCTGVMTLCVASFCITSCYDDSALNSRIDEVESDIEGIDARLKVVEELKTQVEALSAKVNTALYTLDFQVTADGKLQYTLDGTTWQDTGVSIAEECDCEPAEPCDCAEVTLVDNGDSVTISVGDQSFTIEYPQEIVFEIRAGKVYFESESTQNIAIKSSGVDDMTVISYPKGWFAEIAADGSIEVTAPDFQSTVDDGYWNDDWTEYIEVPATAAAEGYVKVHACAVDGKCMVGKLPVIVSARPVSIRAYRDSAYFNAAGTWPATFYYGASPKESFESEVAGLIEQLNSRGWANYPANGDGYENEASVVASISDLIKSDVEGGKEYVVWAIVEDYNKTSYSIEDFIIAYYQKIDVTVVEDEAERTPYNVTVTISVAGADSYYALAVPGNYAETEEDLLYQKENLLSSLDPDSYWGVNGKKYTSDYTGSVLDVAAGTQASMAGNYAPNRDIYLLVLPWDGRSWDEYTLADIHEFKFTTSGLAAGGSVNAVATQVYEYEGEVWSDDVWGYVPAHIVLDRYSQLGVEITPSSDDWHSFYFYWLTDAEWALYKDDDELLVDYLLKNSYGMTPEEIEFPYYSVESAEPEVTKHFVAMFVDKNGKYGTIAKVSAKTDKVEYSDIDWVPADTKTNLTADDILQNTLTLEITPALTETASQFKYVWTTTSAYSVPFEGKDAIGVAKDIFLGNTSYYECVTVTADELVDGKIVIPDHAYGNSYYLAILPYDEAGAPGQVAAIFEYDCEFAIGTVITDSTALVGEPKITLYLPTENDIYDSDGYGDGAFSQYSYYDWQMMYSFYHEIAFDFEPQAGTTVAAAFVDTGYSSFANGDAIARASGLWTKKFGSYYTYIASEYTMSSFRGFNHLEDAPAPEVYLAVSWCDAEGNYYYKEYSLQSELQKIADKMYSIIHAPDNLQLTFIWEDMMGAPSCVDMGVTVPGQLGVCYDAAAVYGEDQLPAEMIGKYQWYQGWEYEVKATDATSGVIILKSYDHFGDLQTTEVTYTDWNGTTCVVNSEMLMLTDVTMTVSDSVIPVYIEQAGGGAF